MKWSNFSQIPIVSLNFTATSYTGIITWNDIDKTGSKLSDISDVPEYTGNANKVLVVNSTEDGVEYKDIATSDELVKADPSDSTPGTLADKVDNTTLEVNTATHKLKVKDGVFAKIEDVESIAMIYSLIF